jgi:hypothetical protein
VTDEEYNRALEIEADYWRKKHAKANERAQYWARMYDELTEIANTQLADDDEADD